MTEYKYLCFINATDSVTIITTKTPDEIEIDFNNKEIIKIDNKLFDFGKFVYIEMYKLEYEINDVVDGVLLTLEDIPINEKSLYLKEKPTHKI